MKSRWAFAVGVVLVTAIDWVATSQGWWWGIPLASVVLGAIVGTRRALLAAAAAAVVAWGGGLIIVATEGSVPRIAQVAGELAGLGGNAGPIVIVVTVLYSALLGAAGGWFGLAARGLVRPVNRSVVAPVPAEPVTVSRRASAEAEPVAGVTHG
jgi:hypothetical protein